MRPPAGSARRWAATCSFSRRSSASASNSSLRVRRYSLDSPGKWTFGSRSTSRHLFMSRGLPLRAIVSILSYAPNSLPCGVGNSERLLGIGNLNNLFFWSELYRRPGELSISFLFDENPNVASVGSGGALRAAPSACVGKRFRLLRLSGIDRLDAPAHGAGRGSVG